MFQRNQLIQIIRDNIGTATRDLHPRQITLPTDLNRVITLTGARRTGKTSLFWQTIGLLRQEIAPDRILYLNLEDDRLFHLDLTDLDGVMDTYFALYPANREQVVYLFFDEIQRIPGWESFIRRIQDTLQVRVFLTGSSASLLGREIATAMRGRTLTFEMFPLSFSEFLQWRGIAPQSGTSAHNAQIQKAFQDYLDGTAFPELLDWQPDHIRLALQEYVDLLVYRDVADRLQSANLPALKYLIHYLLTNAGTRLSIMSIYKDMKGQGQTISKDLLYTCVDLLEDAYAIFLIPLFTRNLKVRQRNPRKLYILDHALKRTVSLSRDAGAILENIVFLHLRRLSHKIHYWQQDQEVDFIIQVQEQVHAVNVCSDLSDSRTRQRELVGLSTCLTDLNLTHGWIITLYHQEIIHLDDHTIIILPAWKWLLQKDPFQMEEL